MTKSQFFGRSQPCNAASSSEEIQHISHVIILLSSLIIPWGPYRSCPCLKIGLIPRPGNRGPELLGGRPRERTGVFALLVHSVSVEGLIQLHLTPVIGRLLASHMLHVPMHLVLYPPQVSGDGPQGWCLL